MELIFRDAQKSDVVACISGFGNRRSLIKNLQDEAAERNAFIVLSVYKNNPAFKLYSALGFVIDTETEKTFAMKWSCF